MPETVRAVVEAYGKIEAIEEVARYLAAVGVEVAKRFPELLSAASMSVPRPEKVMLVLVAMRFPTESVPLTIASPCTLKVLEGEVVPIPTDAPRISSSSVVWSSKRNLPAALPSPAHWSSERVMVEVAVSAPPKKEAPET